MRKEFDLRAGLVNIYQSQPSAGGGVRASHQKPPFNRSHSTLAIFTMCHKPLTKPQGENRERAIQGKEVEPFTQVQQMDAFHREPFAFQREGRMEERSGRAV